MASQHRVWNVWLQNAGVLLNNAVADYRKLIGATDPSKAEEGTIRKLFAKSISANAVHGSDSDENAHIESDFFFSKMERF